MKEDKDPKSHILWCFKQKRGIKLEEPNGNLCNVYLTGEKIKVIREKLSNARP